MKINKEYKEISKEILENENFLKLKNDNHHCTNRYDHCRRVSYLSFLLAKVFHGNTKEAIRAGLLHDFFYGVSKDDPSTNYLNHPKTSVINAKKYFEITDREASIIETHMYHYVLVNKSTSLFRKEKIGNIKEYRPTCKEGVIVCVADLLVSIFEVGRYKVRYDMCLYILFIINLMRY